MSDILLQTIIEKLEALEMALLKQGMPDHDPSVMKEIAEQTKKMRLGWDNFCADFNLTNDRIIDLTKKLDKSNTKHQPMGSTKIEHRHHLHKGVAVSIGLLIIAILLSCGWLYTYKNKSAFEANDIKYRALKIIGNKPLLQLLHNTDSLYNLSQENFHKYVVIRERQFKQKAELLIIADERKKGKK